MILKIRSVGEPVLREQAQPLSPEEIRSSYIEELIAAMRETLRDAPGVGLAAPQVGVSIQLAVIEDREEYLKGLEPEVIAERERKPVAFHVVINPVLTLENGPAAEFFEGCLSLPGYTARVSRARRVRVECMDEAGQSKTIRASGWYARILQHEIDHLQGRLYIDRMQSATFATLENYRRFGSR